MWDNQSSAQGNEALAGEKKLMAREKVITPYFIGGGFGVTKYWVAIFANEGAEALSQYIEGLRTQYVEALKARATDEMTEVAKAGKYAMSIYEKHFGAMV